MTVNDLIKRLQRRAEIYGDYECVVRFDDGDSEIDVTCVYTDDEAERIVLSDDYDPFDE
jgi:hypothetical protein